MNAGQRDAPHSADRCSSRSFLGRIYMYVYTLSPHFVYFVPKCVDHRNRNRTGTGPVPVPVAGGDRSSLVLVLSVLQLHDLLSLSVIIMVMCSQNERWMLC